MPPHTRRNVPLSLCTILKAWCHPRPHRGQGENLVTPSTRESFSLDPSILLPLVSISARAAAHGSREPVAQAVGLIVTAVVVRQLGQRRDVSLREQADAALPRVHVPRPTGFGTNCSPRHRMPYN